MNADGITQLVFGLSAAGTGSALLATAMYQMARHTTLLFALVRPFKPDVAVHGASKSAKSERRYEYSFFLQNVEDVRYPGHLELRILAGGSCESIERADIEVFAGPKKIDFESLTSSKDNGYTCAILTFEELPPYDTWLIRCNSNAPSLTLKIVCPDSGSLLKRRLVIDLYPREIHADASSASRVSVGGAMTPRTFMLAIIALASVFLYVGAILLVGRLDVSPKNFGGISELDALAIAFLLLSLWHGFRRIQRPIYPIMQGYLAPSDLTDVGRLRASGRAG